MIKTIGGYKIIEVEDYPRMQLKESLLLSDEFRESFNNWLADFFGFDNFLEDGHVIEDKPNMTFYVSPRTYNEIQKAI